MNNNCFSPFDNKVDLPSILKYTIVWSILIMYLTKITTKYVNIEKIETNVM